MSEEEKSLNKSSLNISLKNTVQNNNLDNFNSNVDNLGNKNINENLSNENKDKITGIPEPPSFNLEDLPEPPKIEIENFSNIKKDFDNLNNLQENIQNISQINNNKNQLDNTKTKKELKIEDLPVPPIETKKEKKGLFSILFKKKKEEKVELFPKIEQSLEEEKPKPVQTNLNLNVSEIDFAPPYLKKELSSFDNLNEKNNNSNISNSELNSVNTLENSQIKNDLKDSNINEGNQQISIDKKVNNNSTINLPLLKDNETNMKSIKEELDEKYSLNYLKDESKINNQELKNNTLELDLATREKEMIEEGEAYLDKDNILDNSIEKNDFNDSNKIIDNETSEDNESETINKEIEISNVKGIGPQREKKLKKLGIKTAQKLATISFKDLAKKLKINDKEAKKIITNARKITRIKKKLKQTKIKEGVSDLVNQLEKERKKIEVLQKISKIDEVKFLEIESHSELVKILEALEKKRVTLEKQERLLEEKELKLASHDEAYRREIEQIESLRRKLDHDIRERTQYLINLEKEYFQRGQILAKKQSELEAKEKELDEKYKFLKEKEDKLKLQANELDDRSITLNAKEKNYEKIVKALEKQDLILKEKEEDILKREAEYIKKLDLLESHEKEILKNLEEKRRKLEQKEKEIEIKESQLRKKERLVDKKSIALDYEKNIIETEKDKLVDDEFEQYLHEQLGLVKNKGITIDDINFTKNLQPINFEDTKNKIETIYEMISTCKDLLKNNRVKDAKIFYNQIRDKYYSTTFKNQSDKENIQNMLRTLYDEINLADIGSNK